MRSRCVFATSSSASPRHAIGPPRCASPIIGRTPPRGSTWPCSRHGERVPARASSAPCSAKQRRRCLAVPACRAATCSCFASVDTPITNALPGAQRRSACSRADVADLDAHARALRDRRAVAGEVDRADLERVRARRQRAVRWPLPYHETLPFAVRRAQYEDARAVEVERDVRRLAQRVRDADEVGLMVAVRREDVAVRVDREDLRRLRVELDAVRQVDRLVLVRRDGSRTRYVPSGARVPRSSRPFHVQRRPARAGAAAPRGARPPASCAFRTETVTSSARRSLKKIVACRARSRRSARARARPIVP